MILCRYAILKQYETSLAFTSSISNFLVFNTVDADFGQLDVHTLGSWWPLAICYFGGVGSDV